MVKRRRRFKQTLPLKDRLCTFAEALREEASRLPVSAQKEDLLARARSADTAARLDEWVHPSGLQRPT
jgi:hypothetical protein